MMQPVAGLMRQIGRTREFVHYSCMHIEHTLDGPRICIHEHWLNHGATTVILLLLAAT